MSLLSFRWVWRGGELPDITDDYYFEVRSPQELDEVEKEKGKSAMAAEAARLICVQDS
jgi:hypothetical protein